MRFKKISHSLPIAHVKIGYTFHGPLVRTGYVEPSCRSQYCSASVTITTITPALVFNLRKILVLFKGVTLKPFHLELFCYDPAPAHCGNSNQLLFGMENYVRGIPQSERRHFTKLKISAHHLSIERGRFIRPITPRSQRYCSDCKEQAIGDEFHFLLKCSKFAWERRKMFEKFSEFTSIKNNGDDDTFITLMQHLQGDVEVARIVCAFVNECF